MNKYTVENKIKATSNINKYNTSKENKTVNSSDNKLNDDISISYKNKIKRYKYIFINTTFRYICYAIPVYISIMLNEFYIESDFLGLFLKYTFIAISIMVFLVLLYASLGLMGMFDQVNNKTQNNS